MTMFKHKYPYDVPRDELMFITPDNRKKLFYNLLDNYKIFCPGLTLEYAYLNFDSKNPIDYALIFKGMSTKKTPIITWICPYVYAWDSIPGYRYAVKNNYHQQFFNEEAKLMARMPGNRFPEFIDLMCHLSMKEGESYWKNPEYAEIVLDNLSEMYLRYSPKK